MAIKNKYSFMFLMAVASVLSTLSWIYLSINISSTALSNGRRDNNAFLHKTGNVPPPAAFTTTQEAKMTDSTKRNTEIKVKANQTRASTHRAVTKKPIKVPATFKPLSFKDLGDVYNQDAPPRQTTCAQSLHNTNDESFKKAFLPNVPLFLHKDSINMSEWNRLSHYNNPFGFMDYKYDDVMSGLKLIPKPKEPLLLPKPGSDGCVRCAVVATGGILNGSKMGKEIDAHDYVFRMNGAVVKGYEEDVGSRTSVYVHTAHTVTASVILLKKYGYTSVPHDEGIKYVLIPEGIRDFNWLEGLLKGEKISTGQYINRRPWTYYGGQYNESRFYVLHQDFLRYVRNRFLKSASLNASYWALVRPTNGAFTIFLALHTCDTVNAYGFITEDYKKYSNYYVEKNVKTNIIFYGNHDYILEMKLWKKLHDSKIIRLYQRTDSETVTEKLKEH
ncbi:alpha-N-acetylgalactosaminide alpha-2,6-sialyltransferase 2-like [Micropterus dolomieu]|uniref:alpha-N-acetylgalactosaminide alpha-2,6-sialyltransferase 2-like n=1 Tax=Micropterus dolomieu TaxID=147949 RepID=UPI001E8E6FEB|nr:alpha-N-acetylgalactosaminide alpha-2,6-sialyltransferase 2-like [Micropterus dolomieu]